MTYTVAMRPFWFWIAVCAHLTGWTWLFDRALDFGVVVRLERVV